MEGLHPNQINIHLSLETFITFIYSVLHVP
jgi:hypothetical protein